MNYLGNALININSQLPAGWSLDKMLSGAAAYGKKIGGGVMVVLGVILIIFGALKIFKAVTGRAGSEGPEWMKAALALIFGGAMMFGAWTLFETIANGGQNTIQELGGGSGDGMIIPIIEVAKVFVGF